VTARVIALGLTRHRPLRSKAQLSGQKPGRSPPSWPRHTADSKRRARPGGHQAGGHKPVNDSFAPSCPEPSRRPLPR
jgi:hypothetical protein